MSDQDGYCGCFNELQNTMEYLKEHYGERDFIDALCDVVAEVAGDKVEITKKQQSKISTQTLTLFY